MTLIEEYEDSIFKQYLPVFGVFILLVTIGIYQMVNIGRPTEYMIKKGFQGTVTSKFINKNYVYVGLTNKENKQEIRNGYNYAYKQPHLINFIEIGDKLLKNECSDTVYITRGDGEFHFIQLAYWYNDSTRSKDYKKEWMAKRIIRLYQEGCIVDSIAAKYAIELIKTQNE